jgi:hypothetical protein
MKLNVLGLVLAVSAFTSLAASAQTTVIEHRDDPVVIEKDRPAATVTVKEHGGLLGTDTTTKKVETNGDGCTTKTVHHEGLAGSRTVKKSDCD